jgi:hypothetical protein
LKREPVSLAARLVLECDAAKDHGKLSRINPDRMLFASGLDRLKRALLKPLVPQHEAVTIPPQRLDRSRLLLMNRNRLPSVGSLPNVLRMIPVSPSKLFRMSVAAVGRKIVGGGAMLSMSAAPPSV